MWTQPTKSRKMSSQSNPQMHMNMHIKVHIFELRRKIAQLVEHCNGITEVMGPNPVQDLIFSGFNFTTA